MGLGSSIAMSCGVSRRCGSDTVLLRLWRSLAAVPAIRPLTWEPPYAVDAALKWQKQKQKQKQKLDKIKLLFWSILTRHRYGLQINYVLTIDCIYCC